VRRAWMWFVLTGCGTKEDDGSGGGADADTDTDADTDADTDTDTDTDTEPPVTGCYDVPMVVTGGFGEAGDPFVAAPAAGSIAQMVHGPQGGWHVDTAIRVESTHEIVAATPTITLVATGETISGLQGDLDFNHTTVFLVLDGECSGTLTGLRAFIDDVDPYSDEDLAEHICDLQGAEVDVGWDITDVTDGREGTATVRATLALDPMDVAPCESY
jgi:hypothetical protein